jgi:hypothetical protein
MYSVVIDLPSRTELELYFDVSLGPNRCCLGLGWQQHDRGWGGAGYHKRVFIRQCILSQIRRNESVVDSRYVLALPEVGP